MGFPNISQFCFHEIRILIDPLKMTILPVFVVMVKTDKKAQQNYRKFLN